MVSTRSGAMATSNAPEESDSRTSSVGRKRGSAQISQNASTASSSTGESASKSRQQRRRDKSRAGRKRRRQEAHEDDENDDPSSSQKRQKLEGEAENAQDEATPSTENAPSSAVSWNKGVQPTLRTSFGAKAAAVLKGSKKPNGSEEVPASQTEQKEEDVNDKDAASITETTKARPRQDKSARKAVISGEVELSKPTQKLNVGGEGKDEIWVKYSLEQSPRFPGQPGQPKKIKNWIRRELQNRFLPYLLAYNKGVLEKLDENKIGQVLSAWVDHQPAYDDHMREEGHKVIEEAAFTGYCRNQLKAALTRRKEEKKQHKGQNLDTMATENPFGKLISSADVSNAVSDIDENEFEEDEDDRMDIFMAESNDSAEIEDDVTDASDSLQSEAHSIRANSSEAGRFRADSEASHEPHPVDAAIESRLNGSTALAPDTKPDNEFLVPNTPPQTKAKTLPPIAGLPQQELAVLAEVQRYYPGLASDQPHCLTCNEDGHIAAFCPKLTCETCGIRGQHFTYACPQNIICSKCREKGHRVEDCKEKLARSVSDGVVCEICGSTKHIGDNCHLLWRSYNPDKVPAKKIQTLLVDCYSCGALNHFGTECGLRGTRMPYAGQSWTAENRARYLEGATTGSKTTFTNNGGMAIRGMARNDPVTISESEDDEGFIRPKVAQPPRKHLKFADRVSMPSRPAPSNGLPSYAIQPPPPVHGWGTVNGDGHYRAENFANRNGMDYADSFRGDEEFHSFTNSGRDHDELYRSGGRSDEPFRAQGGGGGRNQNRDPFPARQPRSGPPLNRGGRPPQNNGRGGGGGGGGGRSRGPPSGGRGRGGAAGGRGGRGGRR